MGMQQQKSQNFEAAAKFFKRLYFCAKLLEDNDGTGLSLNLIGNSYFKACDFVRSLFYQQKHFELLEQNPSPTSSEGRFISLYNQALCFREMFVRSSEPLNENELIVRAKSLLDKCSKYSHQMNDEDSKVLVSGQIAILHMIPDNIVYSMGEAETRLIQCQKLLMHKD